MALIWLVIHRRQQTTIRNKDTFGPREQGGSWEALRNFTASIDPSSIRIPDSARSNVWASARFRLDMQGKFSQRGHTFYNLQVQDVSSRLKGLITERYLRELCTGRQHRLCSLRASFRLQGRKHNEPQRSLSGSPVRSPQDRTHYYVCRSRR